MSVVDRAMAQLPPTAPWVHFGGPLTEEPIDLSVPEAMVAVMVASMRADEVESVEETTRLTTALSTSRLFRLALGGKSDVMTRITALFSQHGRKAVLDACACSIAPDMRPTAFANAVDLIFADGRVDEREKRYIDELQAALGIDDALAVKIVEVLAIKSRG